MHIPQGLLLGTMMEEDGCAQHVVKFVKFCHDTENRFVVQVCCCPKINRTIFELVRAVYSDPKDLCN